MPSPRTTSRPRARRTGTPPTIYPPQPPRWTLRFYLFESHTSFIRVFLQTDTPNFLTIGWTYRKPFENPRNLFRPLTTGPHHYDYNLDSIVFTPQNESGNVETHTFDIFPYGDCHEIYMAAFDGASPDTANSISPILALTYCATPGQELQVFSYAGYPGNVNAQLGDLVFGVNAGPINGHVPPWTHPGFDILQDTGEIILNGFIVENWGTPTERVVSFYQPAAWGIFQCNGTGLLPGVSANGFLVRGFSGTPAFTTFATAQQGFYNPFTNMSTGNYDEHTQGQPGQILLGRMWSVGWPQSPTWSWPGPIYDEFTLSEPPFLWSFGGTSIAAGGETLWYTLPLSPQVAIITLEDISSRWRKIPARPVP